MYNYNSIKSFFARETWSLHLTDFTDILGWDLTLVDCQPIKRSNGNLRVPPAVLPGLLASARRCFGWWIPGGTCSAMHLCHSYSILFFKTAWIFFYFFLICPFSKAVTFNQHHIHDLFGGHFSHELTSPNLVCTTIVLKCAQHYESGTNDSLSSLFDHIWFVIPRWVCCSLSTYPSSIFWLVMATFIRLMLLLAIDSADFCKVFCFEAGLDAL